jgi:hypothetical protein
LQPLLSDERQFIDYLALLLGYKSDFSGSWCPDSYAGVINVTLCTDIDTIECERSHEKFAQRIYNTV